MQGEIYIKNATSVEDCLSNAIFQMDNIRGAMKNGARHHAHIKARCLLEAAEQLVEAFAQETLTKPTGGKK